MQWGQGALYCIPGGPPAGQIPPCTETWGTDDRSPTAGHPSKRHRQPRSRRPHEPQEPLGALELRPSPPIPPPPVGLGQLSPRLVQSPPPPSGQPPMAPGADRVLGRWLPGKVRALATRTLPSRFPPGGPDTLTPHPDLRDPKKEWQSHWHQQQVHLRRLARRRGLRGHCITVPLSELPGRPWSGAALGPGTQD